MSKNIMDALTYYKTRIYIENDISLLAKHPTYTDPQEELVTTLFPGGLPLTPLILLELPARCYKTSFVSNYMEYRSWRAIEEKIPNTLFAISSNTREHASNLMLAQIKYSVSKSPHWANRYKSIRDQVLLTSDEEEPESVAVIRSYTSKAGSVAGMQTLVIGLDELWNISSTDPNAEARYYELKVPPTPTACKIMTSYAGLSTSGILKGLEEKLLKGTRIHPDLPIYQAGNLSGVVDNGDLGKYFFRPVHHSQAWLDAEREAAPNPAHFDRQYLVRWSSTDGAKLVTEKNWDAMKQTGIAQIKL